MIIMIIIILYLKRVIHLAISLTFSEALMKCYETNNGHTSSHIYIGKLGSKLL